MHLDLDHPVLNEEEEEEFCSVTPSLLPKKFQLFPFGQRFLDMVMNSKPKSSSVLCDSQRTLPLYGHMFHPHAMQEIRHGRGVAERIISPAALKGDIAEIIFYELMSFDQLIKHGEVMRVGFVIHHLQTSRTTGGSFQIDRFLSLTQPPVTISSCLL